MRIQRMSPKEALAATRQAPALDRCMSFQRDEADDDRETRELMNAVRGISIATIQA